MADTLDYGAALAPGARAPANYAASAIPSRGRCYQESPCPTRSEFQRDRDRVIHATAFRRLIHKTQVFIFHEGDHYRTRLTHSLEVAQIARTIARQLRLDEDLAEVLALAHDMGHSPFGHAGERALDAAMTGLGGFDHNAQSLRIVIGLERKYAAFDGLNLSWESLEGLSKHNGPVAANHAVAKVLTKTQQWRSLDLHTYASAEAQVAALSDDIAYLTHDVDDGLRAKLLTIADLAGAPLAAAAVAATQNLVRASDPARRSYEITRRMITVMIADCVTQSRENLAVLAPSSPDAIRKAPAAIVAFSPEMAADIAALRKFLFARVYRHDKVMSVMSRAQSIVEDLFARYHADPTALPPGWQTAAGQDLSPRSKARLVADFVSGQTDRYAMAEHRRLFDATPELR